MAGEVLDLNDLDFVDVGSIIENLQIEPPNPSVAAGTSQKFTLTGTRITASGSARVELTSSANWSSGSPATATIDTDGLALAATAETAVLRMETAATLENLEELAGRTGRGLPVAF